MSEIIVTYEKDRNVIVKGESWVYTDSLNLADVLDVEHKEVMRKIRQILTDYKIEEGGESPPSSDNRDYIRKHTDFTYGISYYKNKQNKLQPFYKLTKDLLMLTIFGFNKQKAQDMQLTYIAKFNEMEKELHYWRARYLGIISRNKFTLAIKDYIENPTTKVYAQYTDLVYQTLFGLRARQIRKMYGIKPNANVRPFLEAESTEVVDALEKELQMFLSYGLTFEKIEQLTQEKYKEPYELRMDMKKVNKHISRQKKIK
ncbi:Rha family transcriptional regulator [Cytobacillus gottheilii]|uniref:Rha family transcriptional regulator n=1 Tax=Cytobacillus gottheilii TaxID=859144 RepID=UPI00159397EA|nr:Rha family transcriptional regulator [Cytobacillus gottheilii]